MKTVTCLNIDAFLLRNRRFWRRLEEHCIADCCGLDAFEFSETKILQAATTFSSAKIVENMEEALHYLEEKESAYIVSHEVLNFRKPKKEIVGILEKVRNVLVGISYNRPVRLYISYNNCIFAPAK